MKEKLDRAERKKRVEFWLVGVIMVTLLLLFSSGCGKKKSILQSNEEIYTKAMEKMEEIQNTAVVEKAEKEEDEDTGSTMSQSDRLFKGTFFRSMSDFR